MLQKILKLYRRIRYQLSPEKRQLDMYMRLMREMHIFSDSEQAKIKELMLNEKAIHDQFKFYGMGVRNSLDNE